ncbi:esterase-like activity of phytase family protein [Sphingopyxis sp.]|uniref:esterase-like activity of phytase family protein n=1 Tax=Sphingopyxis sp. TaxID=1908224 RepID=UPI003D128A60
MRRLLFAALIFLAIGPAPGTVQRFPIDNLTQRATARPLAVAPQTSGALRFVRGWHLTSPHSRFGGFSGLARIAPGRFLLIGDNGYRTRLTLDRKGRQVAADIAPLPVPRGWPALKSMVDSESLFIDPVKGSAWIGLERTNQLWKFDAAITHLEARYAPPAMRYWPHGRGPEAMARISDGRIIIFAEGGRDDPFQNHGVMLAGLPGISKQPSARFFYDSQGKGAVSDAAPLPDGRILLVHRKTGWNPVFTTIIAVVDPADIGKDAVVESQTIGRVPRPLAENYEGAAVTVEQGRTWLWLVADNNFNRWQRSLLLQFELVDLPPKKAPDSKKAAR